MGQAYELLVDELRRQGLLRADQEPDQDDLARALSLLPANQNNAQLLQTVGETAPKRIAKEARRVLHQWRSSGRMQLPASREGQTWRLSTGPRPLEAFLSHIDGRGERLILYSFSQTASPYTVMLVVASDTRGVDHTEVHELSNKHAYRSLISALRATENITYINVDPAYARGWLKHYHGLNRRKRLPVPKEFELYRPALGQEEPLPSPLIYQKLSQEDIRQARSLLLSNSHELLDEREMITWCFEGPQVAQAVERLEARQHSALIISKSAEQAVAEGIKEQLLSSALPPEYRSVFARRLEEMAGVFWETGREFRARQAVALAQVLYENVAGLFYVSFFRSLVEKSITLATPQEEDEQDQAEKKGLYVPRIPRPPVLR